MRAQMVGNVSGYADTSALWLGPSLTAAESANVSTYGLETALPSPKRLAKFLEAMVGNEVLTGLQVVKEN